MTLFSIENKCRVLSLFVLFLYFSLFWRFFHVRQYLTEKDQMVLH